MVIKRECRYHTYTHFNSSIMISNIVSRKHSDVQTERFWVSLLPTLFPPFTLSPSQGLELECWGLRGKGRLPESSLETPFPRKQRRWEGRLQGPGCWELRASISAASAIPTTGCGILTSQSSTQRFSWETFFPLGVHRFVFREKAGSPDI